MYDEPKELNNPTQTGRFEIQLLLTVEKGFVLILVALIYLLGLYLLIKPHIPVATVEGIVDVAKGVSAIIFVISDPGELLFCLRTLSGITSYPT